jgi:hypothetical protein
VKATSSTGTELIPASYDLLVDLYPPDTSITEGPDEGSHNRHRLCYLPFSSNENGQWFKCRLDSTSEVDWRDCSSPKTFTALSNGSHTFEVKALIRGAARIPIPLAVPDRR